MCVCLCVGAHSSRGIAQVLSCTGVQGKPLESVNFDLQRSQLDCFGVRNEFKSEDGILNVHDFFIELSNR